MPSLTCFRFSFTPKWIMVFITVLFFILFMRLGFWQIQRANEKSQMLAIEESLGKQKPIPWQSGEHLPMQYQRIQVSGHFFKKIFFLDNQHHKHQYGYDVLSPLLLSDGSLVIIDRGWVKGDGLRTIFPKIDSPNGEISLQGKVYFPSKNRWVLGPGLEKKMNGVVLLERFDTKLLEQVLQKRVYPFIIRLDEQEHYGFVREWPIVSTPPQRHWAYAVQWFAMALVILILFIILNVQKINEETIF